MKDLYIERIGSFAIFPAIHHSYEFAIAAQHAFEVVNPCAVALEYPHALEALLLRGIYRLPRISVLIYTRKIRSYIRLEPVDPFVEAARLALQRGIEVRCVDLAIDYPDVFEPLPDTYSLSTLGHREYCRMVLEQGHGVRIEQDELRERAMAYHLQELEKALDRKGRPIMVLCGLSHLKGLVEQLGTRQARPFEKPVKAKLYHLSFRSLGEIMGCFPFLTSVYELQRQSVLSGPPAQTGRSVADSFDQLAAETAEASKQVFTLLERTKPENMEEFVARAVQDTAARASRRDRHDILTRYILWCRSYYEREAGDRINPQHLFLLENFSRKYATVKSMLLPDFYELLIAGRGCVNSHFCYRMWEIGTTYPAQMGASELEIIELRAGDIFPLVNKVRMNPNAPLQPRSPFPRFLRRAEKQRLPKNQDWRFTPYSICSYQPEDIAIENYARYLRGKGKSILSEERKRIVPFETSLLDGIDLRETIRNWHSGRIFVKENMTVKGSVDSLVVVFDEDGSKYPYRMTWLGEHNQESDMAFYATDPEERLVGPGIRKVVYGGILMTMPPGRLYDVFGDPAYRIAEDPAERLLLAGIDYGLEKFVLYAAPKPPRPFFQVIAGRYAKRILYLPLAQLSPVIVQKVRTLHILADKSVRDYAGDYIW